MLSSENTLFLHPDWRVDKRVLEMGPMGADQFLITRTPLAGNTLRLSSWFGNQSLTFKRPLETREITIRFRLAEDAQVTVLWGKSDAGGRLRPPSLARSIRPRRRLAPGYAPPRSDQ